jgi:thiol:disulfide interchange protein DsbD
MTVFGFALALPFALFALFPTLLKKAPKSGNWMTTFKVILGFVELIFAIKFLANADNVNHWGYVKREIFLVLWFMLGMALFLYLAGIYRFKTEHGEQKIGGVRYGLSGIALAFALYSGYGVYCHDLPLFSGFPPPMHYSWCACNSTCPLNLNCYHDYCEALEAAKKANKPILIDFTGWACVNCRRMEERVWKKPEIYKIINEDYILLSLYVDDKQPLPEKEQYFSKNLGKQVKTVGNKWFDFEVTCFNNASQPHYALISPDEKLLNDPISYTENETEYKHFLECGLDGFKSIQHKP